MNRSIQCKMFSVKNVSIAETSFKSYTDFETYFLLFCWNHWAGGL